MAQDSRKALDERTRSLMGRSGIKEGGEHGEYQEAQQQLLAIQAEQQQNLAVARAESKASFANNQTMAQAAEIGAISAAEAEQGALAGGSAQPLNPATQAVLNKYGMGKPKFVRSSSHNQQVTRQNITINNNTTVNTTNDVRVPANIGGPVQGRPLQFAPGAIAGSSIGKFKNWISAAFARQNEEGAKRDREYRNRENNLTRSANRMMKKLGDIGKTIGTRMDPRKIGTTWTSQLKTLLFLFGFGYLASNWTKILGFVSDIEKWFTEDVARFFGFGKYSNETSGLKKKVLQLLGADENQTVFGAIKDLIIGDKGLFGQIKGFFGEEGIFGNLKKFFKDAWKERAEAVKTVKFPEIKEGELKNDPFNVISKLLGYLGNLVTAVVSGAEGVEKIKVGEINTKVLEKGNEVRAKEGMDARQASFTVKGGDTKMYGVDLTGRKVEAEIGALAYNDKINSKALSGHTFDKNGNLTDKFGAESSMAQANYLRKLFEEYKQGRGDTSSIAMGLKNLNTYAGRKGLIPVNPDFIWENLSRDDIENLKASGDINLRVPYKVVLRKKNMEDYYRNVSPLQSGVFDPKTTALGNAAAVGLADAFGGTLGSMYAGGTKMNFYGGQGTVSGNIKGNLAFLSSLPGISSLTGKARMATDVVYAKDLEDSYNSQVLKGQQGSVLRAELVKELRPGDMDTGETVYLAEISPKAIEKVAQGVMGGKEGIDLNDFTKTQSMLSSNSSTALENHRKESIKEVEDALNRLDPDGSLRAGIKEEKFGFSNFQPQTPLGQKHESTLFAGLEENTRKQVKELMAKKKELEKTRPIVQENNAGAKELEEYQNYLSNIGKTEEEPDVTVGNKTIKATTWSDDSNKRVANSSRNVTMSELARRIDYSTKFFVDRGVNPGVAAGIVGNLAAEGLFVEDLGYEHLDVNGPSAGIAQFHDVTEDGTLHGKSKGGELSALKKWAADRGKKWGTLDTQLEYLYDKIFVQKFKRGFTSAGNSWYNSKSGTSIESQLQAVVDKHGNNYAKIATDSSAIWAHEYERFLGHDKDTESANSNYQGRAQRALGALKRYDPSAPSTIGVSYSGESTKGKAIISLVGDSYAVGMSKTFITQVNGKGAEGKCITGSPKDYKNGVRNMYCFEGAFPKDIKILAGNAVSDNSSVIVIHAGINGCNRLVDSSKNDVVYKELAEIGNVAKSRGAKVFFIAPITYQKASTIQVGDINCARLLGDLIQKLCSDYGFGLIDLRNKVYDGGKTSSDGIHPASYGQMAKDVVELLFRGGGQINNEVKNLVDNGGLFGEPNSEKTTSEPKSFMSILMSTFKDALFNFGSGFMSTTENIGETISKVGDKIIEHLMPKEKELYSGPITSEFTSYQSYKENPGKLPAGMSYTDWKDHVFEMTGASTMDLKADIDPTEEEKRQKSMQINPKNYLTYEDYTKAVKDSGLEPVDEKSFYSQIKGNPGEDRKQEIQELYEKTRGKGKEHGMTDDEFFSQVLSDRGQEIVDILKEKDVEFAKELGLPGTENIKEGEKFFKISEDFNTTPKEEVVPVIDKEEEKLISLADQPGLLGSKAATWEEYSVKTPENTTTQNITPKVPEVNNMEGATVVPHSGDITAEPDNIITSLITSNPMEFAASITPRDIPGKLDFIIGKLKSIDVNTGQSVEMGKLTAQFSANTADEVSKSGANTANAIMASSRNTTTMNNSSPSLLNPINEAIGNIIG